MVTLRSWNENRSRPLFGLHLLWLLAIAALILASCQSAPAQPPAKEAAPTQQPVPAPKESAPSAKAEPKAEAKPGEVSFRFSWLNIGYNAPFYLAQEKGYYQNQKANVTFHEGSGGDTSAKLIASNSNNMGMTDAGVALKGIQSGMPVTVVAASMRKHPMAVIYPKEKPLSGPKDLVGKTIAMPAGSSQAQLFPAFLAVNKIEQDQVKVALVDAAAAPTTAMEGKADAYVQWWPTAAPVTQGIANYFLWADHGFNSLAEVMIVNNAFLKENPDLVRRFVAAVQQGWQDAQKDPDAAIAAQMKLAPGNFPEPVVAASLKGTLKHVEGPSTMGMPWGVMVEEDWKATRDLLVQYGGLDASVDLSKAWTNEYLPKR